MRKNWFKIAGMTACVALLAGCGSDTVASAEEQAAGMEQDAAIEQEFSAGEEQVENDIKEQGEEQEEQFLSAEESGAVPVLVAQFAEEEAYPELAAFLASYYEVTEEAQSETRYYYNYVDLNDDGTNEIFAVVIGEETEVPFGDPALILSETEDGTFTVLESFEGIHTPVTISEQMTNGWHEIIYTEYGRGGGKMDTESADNPDGGYQTELSEVVDELQPGGGIQILANNLIDDLDQGRYLTLAP